MLEGWDDQHNTDMVRIQYEDGSTSTYVGQREWAVGEQSCGMLWHKKEHKTDQRDEVTWPRGRQCHNVEHIKHIMLEGISK